MKFGFPIAGSLQSLLFVAIHCELCLSNAFTGGKSTKPADAGVEAMRSDRAHRPEGK